MGKPYIENERTFLTIGEAPTSGIRSTVDKNNSSPRRLFSKKVGRNFAGFVIFIYGSSVHTTDFGGNVGIKLAWRGYAKHKFCLSSKKSEYRLWVLRTLPFTSGSRHLVHLKSLHSTKPDYRLASNNASHPRNLKPLEKSYFEFHAQ
jgi:hypothetical protein